MPSGKPAGVRCVQLTDDDRCGIFGEPTRPRVCHKFLAERDICGHSRAEALLILTNLEEGAVD
jgi:uncharacterized protein